jgi:hypothetical protein|tara:strand:+ start:207 stop:563 length:357 start_codon:yes stop_codon:yes gene_type:complete
MEEEMMNENMPNQTGMMGGAVDTNPTPEQTQVQPRLVEVIGDRVENNLQNLSEQETQLITQLNIPQFRNFMSKVFGPEFGVIMETRIPQPQQTQQPVSQPSESPAPMTGGGVMQPPSQ